MCKRTTHVTCQPTNTSSATNSAELSFPTRTRNRLPTWDISEEAKRLTPLPCRLPVNNSISQLLISHISNPIAANCCQWTFSSCVLKYRGKFDKKIPPINPRQLLYIPGSPTVRRMHHNHKTATRSRTYRTAYSTITRFVLPTCSTEDDESESTH